MELELGLAPPNHAHPAAGSCGKTASAEPFGAPKATLPLFLQLRDDNDDSNDRGGEHGTGACEWEMCNGKKNLVGWPPVRSARRRCHVKVSMEGVPIGRKVDLSLHGSYDELLRTLRLMFPPSSSSHQDAREELQDRDDRRRRGRGPYAVTYEDGDGDWLLVGDLPWEDFARSAKRLRILV